MKAATAFALIFLATLTAADQAVYTTKLENGWEDWSWAKSTRSGKTITVVVSKDWQALYLHHKPAISSKPFKAVSFIVNGGAKGGQKLQVRAVVNGKPLKEVYLPALAAGKATPVWIKYADLGLTGQDFEGLWIQSHLPTTFTVSDIALKSK